MTSASSRRLKTRSRTTLGSAATSARSRTSAPVLNNSRSASARSSAWWLRLLQQGGRPRIRHLGKDRSGSPRIRLPQARPSQRCGNRPPADAHRRSALRQPLVRTRPERSFRAGFHIRPSLQEIFRLFNHPPLFFEAYSLNPADRTAGDAPLKAPEGLSAGDSRTVPQAVSIQFFRHLPFWRSHAQRY